MPLSRRAALGLGGAVLVAGSAVAAGQSPESPPPLPVDLRTRLLGLMGRLRVPGLALAAVRHGEIVHAEALGQASLPFGVAADERTLFHMGSVGKHFTAALVLKLAESGKIRLDAPIGTYLHDVPRAFAACPVQSLLSHTSGIPTYDDLPGMEGDRKVTRTAFMAAIRTLPLDFAPGTAWAYSNTGFVLLGRMVEDVTGRTYRRAVTEDLLVPAGLREGRVDDAGAVIEGRAEPYTRVDGEIRHARRMEGDFSGWPDGGVILSARDAAGWEIGLQKGAPIDAGILQRMTEPTRLATGRSCGYGSAWFIDRMAGQPMHYHSGSVDGFIAFWLRLPANGIGVAVMVNCDDDGAHAVRRTASFELAEALAPGSTCWSLPPLHDDDAALTERFRKILGKRIDRGDAAGFAPELAPLIGGKAFAQATGFDEPVTVEPGALILVEAFDEPGGAHVRRYRANMAEGADFYDVGYDPKGRIFRVRDL